MQPPAMGREPFTTPLFVIGGRLFPSRGFPVLQPSVLSASLKTQNSRTVTCRVPWLQQLPVLGLLQDLLPPSSILTMELKPETAAAWCAAHRCPLGACGGALIHPSALFQLLLVFKMLPGRAEERAWCCQEASYSFWEARLGKGPSCHSASVLGSIWPDVCHNKWPLRQACYSQHYTCRQIHQLPSARDAWGQKYHMHLSPILG